MRLNKKHWLLMQVAALLLVTGAFLLVRPHLARAVSVNPSLLGAPMAGAGLPGDPYLVTNCEQLQDINENINAAYSLTNDIDCSATAGWNSGAGFIAIGSNEEGYTGVFDGRGHEIQHLTVHNNDDKGRSGLFANIHDATITNVSLTDASIRGGSGVDSVASNFDTAIGGIAGYVVDASFNRTSFEGSVTMTDCTGAPSVGGLIGRHQTDDGAVYITRSSSTGNLTVEGTNCGDYVAAVGGTVGLVSTNGHGINVADTYSQIDIMLQGNGEQACINNHCRSVGGLIGAIRGYDPSSVTNSYSSGTTELTDNDLGLEYRVGGIVGSSFVELAVSTAFSARTATIPNTCDIDTCDTNQQYYGAIVGTDAGLGPQGLTVFNFHYDAAITPNDDCYTNTTSTSCTPYNIDGLDPDYMKGSTSNGPLGGFNFTTTWQLNANDYPTLKQTSANPGTVTNLSTNVISGGSIEVSWLPANASSELYDYIILCKSDAVATWQICNGHVAPTATSVVVSGLTHSTVYNFRVVARSSDNAIPGNASAVVNGTTATPGFTLVSSCQDLQDMDNDLSGFYELSRNIDCADTVNWNGGDGFDPIGHLDLADYGTAAPFGGILKGNNYTISNLYSDQSTNGLTLCGLFGAIINGGVVQDLKLDNPTCLSNSMTASLAGTIAGDTTITNVHVTNANLGGSGIAVGGLIAVINTTNGPGTATVSKSSFQGSIITNSPAYIGGFAGGIAGAVDVHDNYSDAQITAAAATVAGGFAGNIALVSGASIQRNYATGSLEITSSDDSLNIADPFGIIPDTYSLLGGFTGYIYDIASSDELAVTENFTHMQLSSQSPENIQSGFASLVLTAYTSAFNNYFDADRTGSTDCVMPGSPAEPSCTAIVGQPNYFKNNNTNAPLNSWDFTNVWMTTTELPVFGQMVTSGITTIPPERLNPPATTNPPATDATTTPAADNPLAAALTASDSGGTVKSVSSPTDETGVLGAVKKFVRSLPAGVVVAFPYALFGLLFLAVIVLLVELYRELRRLHLLQILIHKQQLLAEERDAFWHLAANYLRAPVTLIVGGAEALHDAMATPITTDLQSIAASLQSKIAGIMAKIEGSTSLQAISQVKNTAGTNMVRSAVFLIPVITVAILATLGNYAATSYRNMSPGLLGYAAQLAGFILVTVLFYWVLTLLTQGKSKRKAAQDLLDRQTTELANARHELIADTANQLNPDLTVLEGTLKQLTPEQAALEPSKTLTEGTSRLREIVSSFGMLIKVQEGTGAVTANPEASTVDLAGLLTKARAKLTPQITAKGVRVVAPATALAVHAEADLANQVLESIISNAVDYSPANGTVKVEARRLQDAIQLRVTDEGQGIDKKQLDHLFQPFVRADGKSAMDMSHGGFGINLYLDKLIMEQLGGSITASSTPGQGTAITMTWPTT